MAVCRRLKLIRSRGGWKNSSKKLEAVMSLRKLSDKTVELMRQAQAQTGASLDAGSSPERSGPPAETCIPESRAYPIGRSPDDSLHERCASLSAPGTDRGKSKGSRSI